MTIPNNQDMVKSSGWKTVQATYRPLIDCIRDIFQSFPREYMNLNVSFDIGLDVDGFTIILYYHEGEAMFSMREEFSYATDSE